MCLNYCNEIFEIVYIIFKTFLFVSINNGVVNYLILHILTWYTNDLSNESDIMLQIKPATFYKIKRGREREQIIPEFSTKLFFFFY